MMVRTQIQLPANDHQALKDKAAQLGISMSEYLRRLVRDDRQEEEPLPKQSVHELFPLGSSGQSNIRKHKDEYLADAIRSDLKD